MKSLQRLDADRAFPQAPKESVDPAITAAVVAVTRSPTFHLQFEVIASAHRTGDLTDAILNRAAHPRHPPLV
jgi:hypothetical protein